MNDKQDQRLRVHEADGIQEYDNPLPAWWVWLFIFTVVVGVSYGIHLHFMGGQSLIATLDEARSEMVAHQGGGASGDTSEGSEVSMDDPELIAAGKDLFATNCIACHAVDGGGTIGPNLTDQYWIHGGQAEQIIHTISQGVPTKGMPGWEATLGAKKVNQLAAYVLSLVGTTPANPKAPQGELTE